MVKLKKIYEYLDSMAPFEIQMDFDNAGLLLGDENADVKRVLVALDVTLEVAKEAARKKCQLIVSHHPVIFHPLKAILPSDPTGEVVMELLRHNIAVISAHTNLDMAVLGVSTELIRRLGVGARKILSEEGQLNPAGYPHPYGLGRYGDLEEEMAPADFVKLVKKNLKANSVRAVLGERPIKTVAVCGGAGGELLEKAVAKKCDALVTADVKYDRFLTARRLGITLVDAGHFATENPMMEVVWDWLKCAFEDQGLEVFLSKVHKEVYKGI